MKTTFSRTLILLLGCCFTLSGCRTELIADIEGRGTATSTLIRSAKKWHFAHRDGNTSDTILPHWNNAWTMVTANGDQVLIAPGPEPVIMNEALSFSRFFIFHTEKGRISQGRIVEFLGQHYKVKHNTDHLLENYDQPVIIGYNGSVLQYDMNHRQVEDATYENGYKKSNVRVRISSVRAGDVEELMKPVKSEEELKARIKKLEEKAAKAAED